LDARFINPVLNSIVDILVTMAHMQPAPGKPALKSGVQARGVVTGMIAMNSPQATGSIAISFSKPVIVEIVKKMLKMEIGEVDDMARDLVGEISNMMAGGAKARLEDGGFDFELSLPTVVAGESHAVTHAVEGPVIVLPFTTNSGEFFVELCFS